jgi:trk system potassium uptake protein TrkA
MHVIVIGAGEVGSYVAERLSREGHDVALVEKDAQRLGDIEARLDALAIRGSGTDPATLKTAGAAQADLVVAMTDDDEVNIVAAILAKHAGAKRTIVRLQNRNLREAVFHDLRRSVGADVVIDPDEETSAELLELIENPGAIEVEEMAGGEILVLGARLAPDSPVVGRTLHEIALDHQATWPYLFGAITRGDETIIPRGNHQLEAGDLVRVVCMRNAKSDLAALLGLRRRAPRRVMLLGGGRTAELVAQGIVDRAGQVIIVERDRQRASELAEMLPGVQIVLGDITDVDLLDELDIGLYDVVAALTGDDDANILSCLYAKSTGVVETIAVAHRLSLLPLLTQVGIDAALSPRTATASAVMRFARGDVAAVATFLQGDVEILELVVPPNSPAAGKTIGDLRLPKQVLVGAVLSGAGASIGRGATLLEAGDHVILLAKPKMLAEAKEVFS